MDSDFATLAIVNKFNKHIKAILQLRDQILEHQQKSDLSAAEAEVVSERVLLSIILLTLFEETITCLHEDPEG